MTDRKNLKLIAGMFLLVIMFTSMTSALVLESANPIELNNLNTDSSIFFSGVDENFTLQIYGDLGDYITLGDVNIFSPGGTGTTIQLKTLSEDVNKAGFISYNDGTTSGMIGVNINYNFNNPEVSQGDMIVFPTSKMVTVKQGSEKTQNILITVPANYPRQVTIQSVDFNPGTETILFGDLNLGEVSPGSSIQIPIVFSGIDAQTGTYQTQLSIFATDSEGQVAMPTISLTLQVTAGVTPITGDTFSTSPTCSLSANIVNLNNTYSFVCSGIVSNLEVVIPSSEYYIGKNVEVSAGIYKYNFMPIKYGVTEFKAEFRYNGASIFAPFKQELRISSSGSIIAGTDLKLLFTPRLDDVTGDVEKYLIQLEDNRTGSLVSNPRIFVNAIELNSTSDTFEYAFNPNKDYEIRGKSVGYDDLVETINIIPKKIEIKINPLIGDSLTSFNITTSVENATLTILGKEYIGSYYGFLSGGEVEIKAVKEGYKTEIINFTVKDRMKIISFGGVFEKGVEQNFTLSKEGNWVIYHKAKMDSQDRSEYARGTGSLIVFTPEKSGVYVIEVDGIHVGTFEAEGFSFSNKLVFLPIWVWLLLISIIIIIVAIVYSKRNQGAVPNSGVSGLDFHVGDD